MLNTEVVRIVKAYNFSSGIILVRVELRPTEVWQGRLALLPDEIGPEAKDGTEDASRRLWTEKLSTRELFISSRRTNFPFRAFPSELADDFWSQRKKQKTWSRSSPPKNVRKG